jgi:hypothetical protein
MRKQPLLPVAGSPRAPFGKLLLDEKILQLQSPTSSLGHTHKLDPARHGDDAVVDPVVQRPDRHVYTALLQPLVHLCAATEPFNHLGNIHFHLDVISRTRALFAQLNSFNFTQLPLFQWGNTKPVAGSPCTPYGIRCARKLLAGRH